MVSPSRVPTNRGMFASADRSTTLSRSTKHPTFALSVRSFQESKTPVWSKFCVTNYEEGENNAPVQANHHTPDKIV